MGVPAACVSGREDSPLPHLLLKQPLAVEAAWHVEATTPVRASRLVLQYQEGACNRPSDVIWQSSYGCDQSEVWAAVTVAEGGATAHVALPPCVYDML